VRAGRKRKTRAQEGRRWEREGGNLKVLFWAREKSLKERKEGGVIKNPKGKGLHETEGEPRKGALSKDRKRVEGFGKAVAARGR